MKVIKILSAVMAAVITVGTMISSAVQVSADSTKVNAFDVPTSSKVAKVYALKSSGSTYVYTSSSLKTRGTVTYGKSSTAYIDNKTDEIWVLDVGSNWALVTYPIGSGRAKGYIALSAITSASYSKSHTSFKSTGKFYCATRKGNSTNKSYYVDKGETAYVLAVNTSSGANCQIMYPISNGWRIGWASYSDLTKYGYKTSDSSPEKSTSSSSTSSTYSIKNNVITLCGVELSDYKVGSKFSNTNYCKVRGKTVYVGAAQCYGYACYIEQMLYGHCWHTSQNNFTDVAGSRNVVITSTSKLKQLITSAGAGAHIRTLSGHSMVILEVTDKGFTVADANKNGDNKIEVRTYTWSSYLSCSYGKSGFKFIEIHKK